MQGSPLDAKEQVRQAIDIVNLIGEHIELRRQGRNYVGRCLWHDDSRPSLNVNQEKQTWRCWVCDIGGDIFSFVMKRENLPFREAMEMLAERAGIDLKPLTGTKPQPGGPGDKRTLLAACAWAEERFHRCLLHAPEGEPARRYLASRRLSAESIARFRLGFAPDSWDWLLHAARTTQFSPAVLERVGLLKARDSAEGWYDFFRGRVMFPIYDAQARPIAFGGRVLPELADRPGGKYVNSPETPLYAKSRELYALHLAREGIRATGQLVVMEGYTDVIMAHQHGLSNVVAVCGTALGEGHIGLIKRFTDSIALVLDGDEAGRKRASEVLELFVGTEIDLRILTLPGELDPCDFIATPEEGPTDGRGVEAFRRLLSQAPDALEHKLSAVTKGLVNADQTHAISLAAEQVLATLARSASAAGQTGGAALLREQSLLGRLARRLQLPEDRLRQRLVTLRAERSKKPQASEIEAIDEPARSTSLSAAERELLAVMLLGSNFAARVTASVGDAQLQSDTARRLFTLIRDSLEIEGDATLSVLLRSTEDEELKSLLVTLDEENEEKCAAPSEDRFVDIVNYYRQREEDARRAFKRSALSDASLDDSQKQEALLSIFANLKNRQTGPLSTDG